MGIKKTGLGFAPVRARRCMAWRWTLFAAACAALVASGCSSQQFSNIRAQACVDTQLGLSESLLEEAKAQLATHFRQRSDMALEYAYFASQDSARVARSTRYCPDFNARVRRQAIDLIRVNRLFQKLVLTNMRDQDPGVVIGLFGEQYREIFKNDIR